MDPSLKPLLVLQDVEKSRLPADSYRPSRNTYARFAPFNVIDDEGMWEHNQLNWIALFLINMHKEDICESDSNILNQILQLEKVTEDTQRRIKGLAVQLSKNFQNSEEIKGMLNNVQNNQDLHATKCKINEAVAGKPMGSRLAAIEKSIEKLSQKMEGLDKKIDFIASQFKCEG